MNVLFVCDDPWGFDLEGDSTYALMLAAKKRGATVWWCDANDVGDDGGFVANAQPLTISDAATTSEAFVGGVRKRLRASDFSSIWMRKDPPVDTQFLQTTWLLQRAMADTVVVNDPRALREVNEHLSVLSFPDITPKTIVTANASEVMAFAAAQGGRCVVKPIDGFGGLGVFIVDTSDSNASSILETSTRAGRTWTMAQAFLPEAKQGDKRILWAAGQTIGAVLRVPASGESRGNLHVGGSAEATEVTEADKRIVATLTPFFKAHNLSFVGIDVIGGLLTEINITSPTGLRHLDRLAGVDSASAVWDAVEKSTCN